jgi:hypothetical protein
MGFTMASVTTSLLLVSALSRLFVNSNDSDGSRTVDEADDTSEPAVEAAGLEAFMFNDSSGVEETEFVVCEEGEVVEDVVGDGTVVLGDGVSSELSALGFDCQREEMDMNDLDWGCLNVVMFPVLKGLQRLTPSLLIF